jgi:enamine deaminase RidA (YjgF/YER057c/UK114 family)
MTIALDASREEKFQAVAAQLGHSFDGEIKIGGNYTSVVRHGEQAFVSGQIPRVGSTVMVMGRVGRAVGQTSLAQAQTAAKICAMRALALLRLELGSLDAIAKILRMTIYVQAAEDFTQLSEVGDAASEVLYAVLSEAGVHTRTSVGVFQLPKNASVELDLIAAINTQVSVAP